MATAEAIREQAATRLKVLGEGQTLKGADTEIIDQAYLEVYARLGAKNLAVWDFDEEVPDEYVTHVVAMVAFSRVDDFQVSNDLYQRLAAAHKAAIPEMRELQGSDTYKTPQPDYF